MAELGVIASGMGIASLAIQIGDSIIKFKNFWDSVKEAPEEIKWLIDEIETLSHVLSEMGSSGAHGDLPPVAPEYSIKCLDLCRKGADILETLLRDLDAEIGKKKKVGGFKAVLKKGTIERLKERLRSAQFMLMLSNQTYSEALQRQRHDLQRQWAELQRQELSDLKTSVSQSTDVILSLRTTNNTQINTAQITVISAEKKNTNPVPKPKLEEIESSTPSDEKSEYKTLERKVMKVNRAQTRQQSFMARFSGPRWISWASRVLELSGQKSPSGWNFSIRTYNIVHVNSDVMRFARLGDIPKMQKLFQDGKASPFDRDNSNRPVFRNAIWSGKANIVRFLLDQGTDRETEGHEMWCYNFFNAVPIHQDPRRGENESTIELLDLLAKMTDFDDITNGIKLRKICGGFSGNAYLFDYIIRTSETDLSILSIQDRVFFTIALLYCQNDFQQHDAVGLVRSVWRNIPFDDFSVTMTDVWGRTIFHALAWNVSTIVTSPEFLTKAEDKYIVSRDEAQRWVYLIEDYLEAGNGKGLHSLAAQRNRCHHQHHKYPWTLRTPFLMVLAGYFTTRNYSSPFSKWFPNYKTLISVARTWLIYLKTSGVNLLRYGRREHNIHIKKPVAKEFFYCRHQPTRVMRLVSFTYGDMPEDWTFNFVEVMSETFKQFWECVEDPEWGKPKATLPGSWVEEDVKPTDFEYAPEFPVEWDGSKEADVSVNFDHSKWPCRWS